MAELTNQTYSPPRVGVSIRRTVNLGDYNSVSMEVSMEDNVLPGQKQSEVLETLSNRASTYLVKKLAEVDGVVL